jgi:putative heme-binding domain-containing protein
MWTLAGVGRNDPSVWFKGSEDPVDAVRVNAIGVATAYASYGDGSARSIRIPGLIEDASPRVRLAALVAVGDAPRGYHGWIEPTVRAWPMMTDPWTRNAAIRLASADPLAVLEKVLDERLEVEDQDLVEEAFRRASHRTQSASESWPYMAVSRLSREERAPSNFLAAILDRIETPSPPTPRLRGEIDDAARSLEELISGPNLDLALAALRLVERWTMTDEMSAEIDVLALKLISVAEQGNRVALTTLLELPAHRMGAIKVARRLLRPSAELDDQIALVEVLGQTEDVAAARVLCDAYSASSSRVQDQMFEKLIARTAWSVVLLDAIEAKRIDARELGPQKLHRLRTHADAAVAARSQGVLRAALPPTKEIDALVASLLPEVDRPGDAAHGKEVFTQNCAGCHAIRGQGGKVGPDLAGMGAHGARALLSVMLDPNRAVEPAFTEWNVETEDGRVLGGVLARESADSVLLRWSGGEEEIPRSEIASMRNTLRSPMPTGFEALGAAALRDVIAYLAEGTEGFRTLDLESLATSNSHVSLYDARRDPKPIWGKGFGIDSQTYAHDPIHPLD